MSLIAKKLIAEYEIAVNNGELIDDPKQRQLLCSLDALAQKLQAPQKHWFSWKKTEPIMGLYVYGSVGVGKTFLMDLFFEKLGGLQKMRVHFHHFMQQIDEQLRRLQGQKNPLKRIAIDLAKSIRLLYFDEFMVDDVTHAMIIAQLLQILLHKGVVLVATSNRHPDNLYLKGLHRERFLPVIAAIKSYCHVISLDNKKDYRLNRSPEFATYFFPLGSTSDTQLQQQFEKLVEISNKATNTVISEELSKKAGILTIQNRDILYMKRANQIIWFDFKVICNLPRSQLDYLEIANHFNTIFVSNIPKLHDNEIVFVILLIYFVDVMYDQGISLILSADAPIDELYQEGEMSQEFKRTSSRLHEMQSVDYLQRHPRRFMKNIL